MSINAGETILASDFINKSEADPTPANDEGRVPKLESDGKISPFFIKRFFGGDGSDGALNISSGTTTIDLLQKNVVVLNYTSISITGTGKLAFSNASPLGTLIILKSQGDVTLTSSQTPMIDASGLGASGGLPGFGFSFETQQGANGTNAGTQGFGVNGKYNIVEKAGEGNVIPLCCGASGGNADSGTGGAGGAGLLIECNGEFNFTTGSISVAGANGNGGGTHGGGGGGAGGILIVLYNTLGTNTGTVNYAGGAGANGNGASGGVGGNGMTGGTGRGGDGGSGDGTNHGGAAGGSSLYPFANGSNGGNSGSGPGSGGGASGGAYFIKNKFFY